MKRIIFPAMSLTLLWLGVGCATRAVAKELPHDFPASTAVPLRAESNERTPLEPTGSSERGDDDRGHEHHHGDAERGGHSMGQQGVQAGADTYACPMHPEVTAEAPGTCPICGMHLEKRK